jgi:molybdenum cofactor cytidylyltransferase
MPRVTEGMVSALVRRYRETGARLVVSDYAGVAAPPTLYSRALFEELRGAAAEEGGRAVVARHRAEAESLRWPAEALADLDVPEDYARLGGD